MKLYARQGDLIIEKLTQVDGDFTKATNLVFAGDSSQHRHRLLGTVLMQRVGRAIRVQVAESLELVHETPGGHKTVLFVPGAYEVRPQRERGDQGDRAVED